MPDITTKASDAEHDQLRTAFLADRPHVRQELDHVEEEGLALATAMHDYGRENVDDLVKSIIHSHAIFPNVGGVTTIARVTGTAAYLLEEWTPVRMALALAYITGHAQVQYPQPSEGTPDA